MSGNLVLGVDASASSLYLAIKGEGISLSRSFISIRNTDTMLLDEIKSIISYAGATLNDISYFAHSEGPGSFTSLRIASSTLKGLSFAKDIKIKSVPTLDVLYHSFEGHVRGVVVPLIDARMHRFYTAMFKNGEKILEDSDLKIEDILSKTDEKITFVYHPLEEKNILSLIDKELLRGIKHRVKFAHPSLITNPALTLIDLSYSYGFDKPEKGPKYVREHSGVIK